MHSLPQEFLALCRQLGDAQQRCSAAIATQAAQIDALTAEVVRLRGAVVLRDTRLAIARDELEQLQAAHPWLPRRKAMARHIGQLAERITALSRECLRWRQAAAQGASTARQGEADRAGLVHPSSTAAAHVPAPLHAAPLPLAVHAFHPTPHIIAREDAEAAEHMALDANLAAADLVICQTGCISHDQYWRVQDHCRRTGKPCILVDQPLAVREAEVLAAIQPMVVLRMTRSQYPAGADGGMGAPALLNENAT
ncbi:hypothetical protein ASF11_11025 [Acidovorax sp. Leaf76]|uniref:DUF2325 domain-containing protein n=1 Tax=unclassified Acidovorax TaxID=2684926 RepID=UPI0006F5A564|nr:MULTISPECIES: DUF2325 domain-containing protein [unclassified Acidovorax]KQO15118.1 hypothetical protein ASF11_11025 [Acidovorax sp. Leaf76]KQO31927.1 hypothetical protein ASF19_10215 [Acidovorax sp. Leaf84]KQS28990.1 hypothetical protein ASG27_12080 [Acidovorax sp. Leaf191]